MAVAMVTKILMKHKWLPQSPIPGSSKPSKIPAHSPRILRRTSKLTHSSSSKSSTISFSVSSKYGSCIGASPGGLSDDIVLGSWVKPQNPRRTLDYDLFGYHCWVSLFSVNVAIIRF